MRVTEYMRMQAMVQGVHGRSARLNDLYEKLATQREVLRPSDDPVKTGTIMRISSHVSALEQNITMYQASQSFLDAATEGLDGSAEKLMRAKNLAVRAANGTFSAADRQTMANEVNQLLESIVQYANQSFEGRYIFSGAATDTLSLGVTRNAEGYIDTVTYQGAEKPLEFPLGRGRRLEVSITGKAAFLDTGMIDSVMALRDHLMNKNGLSDSEVTALVQQDLTALTTASAAFLGETGKVASRAAELEVLTAHAQSAVTRATEVVSGARDVDLAQLAVDLNKEETVYQALLTASSNILRVTLMDYLR